MQIKPCAVFPVPKKMKSALVYFSSSMQGGSGAIFQFLFTKKTSRVCSEFQKSLSPLDFKPVSQAWAGF